MREKDTIFGSRPAAATRLNGLLVPNHLLSNNLQRYVDPALFYTEGIEPFSMTLSGSISRIKYADRYFAAITCHQLDLYAYHYRQLVLANRDRGVLITSHAASFPNPIGDQRAIVDCILFEYTRVVDEGALSPSIWYDVSNDLFEASSEDAGTLCALGYPGHRNAIDYDSMTYKAGPNCVWGYSVPPTVSDRFSFIPRPAIKYSPDGMSGGPVFKLVDRAEGPEVRFAGILANASRHMFNYVPTSALNSLITQLKNE